MRDLFDNPEPQVVVGVSELIEQLRDTLAESFGEVWVEGEIGSLHVSRPGHLYFDLKDEDGQLRCVIFRNSVRRLGFDPEDGMRVRARARPDIYPERGTLQLIAEELVPAGEGALRLQFEKLKERLHAEGLFDVEHKRALPSWPERIGLVTSLQGAAVHDFVRGARRRAVPAELLIYDARVQGEGAWREVVRGLQLLDADPRVQVIVLSRGGGSLEDLWTFNREELVRAIFAAQTPVVSAIGHEVDLVLSDLVADLRAATPTAAAELVLPDGAALARRVDELGARLVRRQRHTLERGRGRLEGLRRGLVHPAERLAAQGRRLQAARARLALAATRGLELRASSLSVLERDLQQCLQRGLERRAGRLGTAGARLHALSPLAVLGRGYSVTRRAGDGAILRSHVEAPVGSDIDVRLARGALRATVTESREDE